MNTKQYPVCRDKRPCFARVAGKCKILTTGYTAGCPFCKSHADITHGKEYPYDPFYRVNESD